MPAVPAVRPARPNLTVRAGHPDFLDLPWHQTLVDWDLAELVDLPKGISRHEVRFLDTAQGIYVIKELPERAARNDYQVLRILEDAGAPAVVPVSLVAGRSSDPHDEASAALITAYESFSFSYRELLAGPGFGPNRTRMLDAFAGLLVELHLAGCYWGDCSLSNVLYRWDAETIETIMVDAETAFVFPAGLSDGQRREDIGIMVENVAGGMADIASAAGVELDSADLAMGEEIAQRYDNLWAELATEERIRADERYRISERIERVNALGFDVQELDVVPAEDDTAELRLKLRVGGRNFHTNRLHDLTGIFALDAQARQILSDLHYYQARAGAASPARKEVAAVRWRVSEFEPIMARISELGGVDPIQAYCDLLNHRYRLATAQGRDVPTLEALEDWLAAGRPGYEPA